MKREIVFVCQYMAKGGAERVLSILIDYLSKRYNVAVVLLYEKAIDYKLPTNIKLIECHWTKKTSILAQIKDIISLREVTRGKIVISFLYSAIRNAVACSIFNNTVIILSERNDPSRDPKGWQRRILRNLCYYFANSIVFQTREQKSYFSHKIQKKGVVIANPVTKDLPEKKENNNRIIISVCRYDAQKNIKMAIDAFEIFDKAIPGYCYHLYGKGELQDELNRYIREKGLIGKVVLKGFSTDIHSIMASADMFVSSSDYEGISNSMLEALAIGIPCICTDCPIGGAREVIENMRNGILVNVGDVDELANSMIKVANDKEFSSAIAMKAKEVRGTYSEDEICEKWDRLIKTYN